jgi:hypothetical protein
MAGRASPTVETQKGSSLIVAIKLPTLGWMARGGFMNHVQLVPLYSRASLPADVATLPPDGVIVDQELSGQDGGS